MQRLLLAVFCYQTLTDLDTNIIFTKGNHRLAVISVGFGRIYFIATLRAMLMHLQRAVRRQRLRVTMGITPDLGQRHGFGKEEVVRRHTADFVDTNDLAMVVGQSLLICAARIALTKS